MLPEPRRAERLRPCARPGTPAVTAACAADLDTGPRPCGAGRHRRPGPHPGPPPQHSAPGAARPLDFSHRTPTPTADPTGTYQNCLFSASCLPKRKKPKNKETPLSEVLPGNRAAPPGPSWGAPGRRPHQGAAGLRELHTQLLPRAQSPGAESHAAGPRVTVCGARADSGRGTRGTETGRGQSPRDALLRAPLDWNGCGKYRPPRFTVLPMRPSYLNTGF